MSLTECQPNFAYCLTISCAGTLYIHFRELLAPDRILLGAKFTLRPSLAFSYIGSITARHFSSGCQPNFAAWYKEWITELSQKAPPIFTWAVITLGIGPYSSCSCNFNMWLLLKLHCVCRLQVQSLLCPCPQLTTSDQWWHPVDQNCFCRSLYDCCVQWCGDEQWLQMTVSLGLDLGFRWFN